MHVITRVRARVFGGINFGDLVKNLPIRQIKIPAKVSGYMVYVYSSDVCECESPVLTPKPFHYYSCISNKNMATISCTCHQGMALGLKFS